MQMREITVNIIYTFEICCHCTPLIAPGEMPSSSTAILGATNVLEWHLLFAHSVFDAVYLVLVE